MDSEDRLRRALERRRAALERNAGEIDEWRDVLRALWSRIGEWLRPLAEEGLLKWEVGEVLVERDETPPYLASAATVSDSEGCWRVEMTPVGRFVLGGPTGRVDITHGPYHHMLLRTGVGPEARWEFQHGRRRPARRAPVLKRKHILDVLADMLGPWADVDPEDGDDG